VPFVSGTSSSTDESAEDLSLLSRNHIGYISKYRIAIATNINTSQNIHQYFWWRIEKPNRAHINTGVKITRNHVMWIGQ
jgi:hypothetical protein